VTERVSVSWTGWSRRWFPPHW